MESTAPTEQQGRLLDGKALAATIRAEVAEQVRELEATAGRVPGLAVILVGDDPASQVYVRNKTKACAEVGMEGQTVRLPETVSQDRLHEEIERINADASIDGLLVQLPLPAGLPVAETQQLVAPDKDVDCLHPDNVGRLWLGQPGLAPATPRGIIELLHRNDFELQGKRAVIIGRSNIVGKPMAALLLRENCTVTVCHSRTRDLPAVCREADILIAAVGRAAMVDESFVKPGAVVIDVGTNRLTERALVERIFPDDERRLRTLEKRGGVLCGDVDFHRVRPIASAITPVPGGVGPLTIALLLVNTLDAARRHLAST